jgi:hypothetical protein
MHPTRIFKKPEQLYKSFESYKKDVDKQSKEWLKIQYVGKDGAKKQDGQKVPYTMEGFERYCYNNHGCVHHYFDNKEGYYDDFGTICSRIKKEIRENQIVGGMLGFYNPSITQRLNSLADTQNNNVNIEQPLFPD